MRRVILGAIVAALALAVLGAQASAGDDAAKHRGKKVTATNFDFTPPKVSVSAGSKVTWVATEGDHTVTFKDGKLDEEISEDGTSTVSRKFKSPGTYKYICRFHKNKHMKGKVVVH
jgi:plastocyanin